MGEKRGKRKKFPKYPDDLMKFKGEYIAFKGDHIFAHGKDACEVLSEARKYAERPILEKIPETVAMIL